MKKLFKKDFGEEHNFWMSYTDLMSGFLVVFIILSAILYNHYNDKVAEAEKAQQEAVVKQDLYEEAGFARTCKFRFGTTGGYYRFPETKQLEESNPTIPRCICI